MANWYGTSRTNYFKVKDAPAFKEAMGKYAVRVVEEDDHFALVAETDDGSWPSCFTDDEPDADFVQLVTPHLADGEVAVFMTAGAEKARYVTGYALAANNKGETEYVDLNFIYTQAEKKFGVRPTRAEY